MMEGCYPGAQGSEKTDNRAGLEGKGVQLEEEELS